MADNKDDEKRQAKERTALGLALGIGFNVAVPLALFVVGGVWLDSTFKIAPLFTLVGVFLGLFASGYYLYRLSKFDE
jgi:ABC-type antimicrobial peptide transport system permease subunit